MAVEWDPVTAILGGTRAVRDAVRSNRQSIGQLASIKPPGNAQIALSVLDQEMIAGVSSEFHARAA